jgi:hypothetical protein
MIEKEKGKGYGGGANAKGPGDGAGSACSEVLIDSFIKGVLCRQVRRDRVSGLGFFLVNLI